jgi:hypothetical protein
MADFRISKAIIKGMDEDSILWAIIEPIWPSLKDEDDLEYISQGTKGQKAIYSLTLFMREVDNGGIEQFLMNSSGKYINMVLEGFELINATKHVCILKNALNIFPDCQVPIDQRERQNVLMKQLNIIKLTADKYFEQYNDLLYGEEQLKDKFFEYIDNNEEEFYKD